MDDRLSQRLVPDELWELVHPLLPEFSARPQGGGTAPADDRAVFTAIVYVLIRHDGSSTSTWPASRSTICQGTSNESGKNRPIMRTVTIRHRTLTCDQDSVQFRTAFPRPRSGEP